jgi:hypothetical protein
VSAYNWDDDIRHFLSQVMPGSQADDLVAALKRQHAHELAESIRENFAYCEDPNGTGACCGVANVLMFIHSETGR